MEKVYLIFGVRENFGEVRDARKGWGLKPGMDVCLKDGKGVYIPTPCIEEINIGRLWVGWVACGVLCLESSHRLAKCQRKGVNVLGCRD